MCFKFYSVYYLLFFYCIFLLTPKFTFKSISKTFWTLSSYILWRWLDAIRSLSAEVRPCAVTELFCRGALAEGLGWAQRRREEAAKWTVMQTRRTEAGTGSSISSTVKACKGIWQVEEAEMMASAQRLGLELLKKRTQRAMGESQQSCTGTEWVPVCVLIKCPRAI